MLNNEENLDCNKDVIKHLPKSYQTFYNLCLDEGVDIMKKSNKKLKNDNNFFKKQCEKNKKNDEKKIEKNLKSIQKSIFDGWENNEK